MEYSMFVLQCVFVLSLLYFYIRQKFSYWSKLGVNGPEPSLLQFGNIIQIASTPDPISNEIDLINKHGKVYGTYNGFDPVLTLTDADLIKQVLVKDFNLFVNRRPLGGDYSMISINQFFAKSDKWRRLRAITRPNFTSAKLKEMIPLMTKCVERLHLYLDTLATKGDGIMKVNEVMSGFTIDAICSIAFGTETNANDDRSKQNPIVVNAMQFFEINPALGLFFLTMPGWFNKMLGTKHFFNEGAIQYFCSLMREVVKQRIDGSVKRKDLVQLLLETRIDEEELKSLKIDKNFDENQNDISNKLSEEEIIAQCVLFMAAGYETSAMATINGIYELTTNQDVQERLYTELKQALDGVELNSDEYNEIVLNKIPYLEAVFKETLRKYPSSNRLALDRQLNADNYKIGGILLKKGQIVEIPILGVHHNPEYWPEPERFNPDRFMPENKDNIVAYGFLPFGAGPRNCIGMRYAYQEIKLCLARIVREFKFTPTADTPDKLVFKPFKFTLNPKHYTVKVTKR